MAAFTPTANYDWNTHPLVAAAGGKITGQQMQDYYSQYGNTPNWQQGPEGPIIKSGSASKFFNYTNPGSYTSNVGTTASGTGASAYTPIAVQQAVQAAGSNMQGATQMGQAQLLADLYSGTGVANLMNAAPYQAGAPGPTTTPNPQLPTSAPPRSRTGAILDGQIPPGVTTAAVGGGLPTNAVPSIAAGTFGSIDDFVKWFSGQGPRQSGVPPGYNMPAPVLNANNELMFPGMVGKTFGNDPQWLSERVQASMLMKGMELPGAASPVIPPHLLMRAGLGPESVLGGDWSVNQRSALPGFEEWIAQQPGGGINLPGGYYGPGGPGSTGGGPGGIPPTSVDPGTPGGGIGTPGGGQPPPGQQPPPGGGPAQTNPITGQPIQPGQSWIPGTSEQAASSVDNSLAYLGGDIGWLRGIAENAGYATNVSDAWQSMIAAQQENIDRGFADLSERMNVGGTRFGTDMEKLGSDYYEQTAKDQNALLGQLTIAAQEAARGRELSAAQGLGQMGYGALSQLSGQDFQAQLQQMQQAFQAGQNLFGAGAGAANQLAGQGAQGALAQLQAAMQGAQGMFGTEVGAAMADPNFQLALQQLGLQGASSLSDLWQQNLQTGLQVGGAQYGLQQDQIDRLYQEWLRTQSTYNPLLPYMYASATGYPPVLPQQQSGWPQALGMIGGMGLGGLLGNWGDIFG